MTVPSFVVETVSIDTIRPYAANARIIPQSAIDMVAGSIKANGWQQPIVVDEEGVIIVGHTRCLAAKQLGLTHVPVKVARGLTPVQIKAYRLADNRTNQETAWDNLVLADEILRLVETPGFDVSATGFTDSEVAALTATPDGDGLDSMMTPPSAFKLYGKDIETDVTCPHCQYRWKRGAERASLKDLAAGSNDD